MKNKTSYIIIGLLIIASFLLGSIWTKIRITEQPKDQATEQKKEVLGEEEKAFAAPKKKTPEVKFFVMSFCPYGNQAEAGLKPVAELLGNKVSWQPRYIVSEAKEACEARCANSVYDEKQCQQLVDNGQISDMDTCKKYFPYKDKETCLKEKCAEIKEGEYVSLHGEQELNQDVREICAWNIGDSKKWWSFVDKVNKNCSSSNADTCWEKQAKQAGLDVAKIKDCQKNQVSSLLVKEIKETEKYSASGSPMVFINDKLYDGGRAPEDYKKAICAGFEKVPAECEKVLGTASQGAAGGCQ